MSFSANTCYNLKRLLVIQTNAFNDFPAPIASPNGMRGLRTPHEVKT